MALADLSLVFCVSLFLSISLPVVCCCFLPSLCASTSAFPFSAPTAALLSRMQNRELCVLPATHDGVFLTAGGTARPAGVLAELFIPRKHFVPAAAFYRRVNAEKAPPAAASAATQRPLRRAAAPTAAGPHGAADSFSKLAVTRLLCLPSDAPLLQTLLSAAAAAFPRRRSVEACVAHAAAACESATALSGASLVRQQAEVSRTCVRSEECQGRRKSKKNTVSSLPGLSESGNCFIFPGGALVHSSTPNSSKRAAATHTPLAATAAATLLTCRGTCSRPLSVLRPCHMALSRCSSTSWGRICVPFDSFYPSSSASFSPPLHSAPRLSLPPQGAPFMWCRHRSSSLKLSRPTCLFLTRPALWGEASGFRTGRQSGCCLFCSTRNITDAASQLGYTLVSHIRRTIVAFSRKFGTGTSSSVDSLLLQVPRLFEGLFVYRNFPRCARIVDISRQDLLKQLLLSLTRRFAHTLQAVATRFTGLLASPRAFTLAAENTRSWWISAAMEAVAECAAAAAAFWGTCAASLLLQKNIGVSCAAKTCKLFGVATVFAASNAAAGAGSTLRYIIETLHNRQGTGNAVTKLQLPTSIAEKPQTHTPKVQPDYDTAADQLHKSISAFSQQQTRVPPLHSSVGVAAAEAAGAADIHAVSAAPALEQQKRALAAGSFLQEAERVREQHGGLTTGDTAGGSLDRFDVVGAKVNNSALSSLAEIFRAWGGSPEALHLCVKEGVLGCVVFWLLGGRFFRLSPSSLLAPGAYHQHHLSLRAGVDYASLEERRFIKKLGETFGCHTCGRRRGVEEWVADHQPPKSVVVRFSQTWLGWMYGSLRKAFGGTRYLPQRFYPQCKACSNKQATVVKQNAARARKADLVINWSSLRSYHLTGGVLQFLRLLAGW